MSFIYLAGGTAGPGVGVTGAGVVVVGLRFGSLPEAPPFDIKPAEKTLNSAMMIASIQVPFSKTSVVCLTPMN